MTSRIGNIREKYAVLDSSGWLYVCHPEVLPQSFCCFDGRVNQPDPVTDALLNEIFEQGIMGAAEYKGVDLFVFKWLKIAADNHFCFPFITPALLHQWNQ